MERSNTLLHTSLCFILCEPIPTELYLLLPFCYDPRKLCYCGKYLHMFYLFTECCFTVWFTYNVFQSRNLGIKSGTTVHLIAQCHIWGIITPYILYPQISSRLISVNSSTVVVDYIICQSLIPSSGGVTLFHRIDVTLGHMAVLLNNVGADVMLISFQQKP